MACISFGVLPCKKKKLDDISRLSVVEITRVPDMLPNFSFLVGLRTYQHPGTSRLVGTEEARRKRQRTAVLFGKCSESYQLGKGVFVRNLITAEAKISRCVGYRISHIEVQRWLVLFIARNTHAPLN